MYKIIITCAMSVLTEKQITASADEMVSRGVTGLLPPIHAAYIKPAFTKLLLWGDSALEEVLRDSGKATKIQMRREMPESGLESVEQHAGPVSPGREGRRDAGRC